MKRVRKYTYLPQEEIEVIETKSGQTIKSKEILDGNYVKAKPAPKKVVKKAIKKKYAKGGKLVGNQKKLDVNKNGKLDAEDFKMLRREKMADGGEIEVGDKVKAKYAKYHATVTEIVDDVEVPYAKITYSDGRVKKADLQNLQKVTLAIAPEYVNPDYMAKGGKTPIVRTQFEEEEFEYADGGEFKGYKADKKEKFTYTLTGEELRKFKYRSFSEQIENARKFKELIEKVYEAQPEGDIYPIEFIKAQARTTFSMGKDDKGKIYVLGTYGRGSFTHFPFLNDKNFIEALKYVDRPAIRKFMADGGMLDEDEAKARKSILRDRNRLVQMNVGKDDKSLNFAIKLIDMLLDGELHSVSDVNDVDGEAKARKAIMRDRNRLVQMNVGKDDKSLNFAIKLIDMLLDGELDNTMAKGGMMAKGGSIQDVEKYIADKYFYGDMRGFSVNKDNKGNYELYIDNIEAFEAEYGEEKAYEIETDINSIYAKGGYMADGGKVTDKEVADSNVHMLQSNIKSIKHHAEELEQAIKDNTEVEGWVLAKADRAATAMSDITHYIDGRKMGTGGMVAGIYYKDKTGEELRFIGPDSRNDDMGIFKDGEKYVTKPFNDFEEEKEKKSFWFGNGGYMPSGFSRKVTLSEKAEEMVGKNTWHILDAAQKGEVIGELISDGALAVTMDRGGIVDAEDWSKSSTNDKMYALKKAGYSENIASEMSLLPYEQLPMWVRQDFKKGSIVIGAYHIHKNDNQVPIDSMVLVLNGDEEVVYSAETLDQAQEWAINQMQEVEDDGNYIYVSDCCGAEAGSSYDIGICPMCREHCEWEKESTYADGGITEATKFKVVYKLRDAAEPKEKLFDNAEKAEFFLETIKDDDDIMSANLVEVKPMKKAAEKKAATNLFAAAKPAAPSASKKTKEDVLVPGIADKIARYDALKAIIKNAEAEKEVIGGALKEVGKEKFLELYELRRRNPETFNLADEDEKIMFIVMDKYIKVEPEKAGMLENYPGLLETTTTYKFNPALLDKTGEIVSRLIMESTELSDDEKANLIVAETKIGIKTGSIDRLMDYDNPTQIFDLIEPILALK